MTSTEKPMADEQVTQIDEELEEAAESGGGVPEFPVDPPDVPAPAP
jgi:hypothetical protein